MWPNEQKSPFRMVASNRVSGTAAKRRGTDLHEPASLMAQPIDGKHHAKTKNT